MEEKKLYTMDDLRRVLIPNAIRSQIGLESGDKLSGQTDTSGNCITLCKAEDGQVVIDDLGRVTLDLDCHKALGWTAGDKLAICPGQEGGSIKITLHKKSCD